MPLFPTKSLFRQGERVSFPAGDRTSVFTGEPRPRQPVPSTRGPRSKLMQGLRPSGPRARIVEAFDEQKHTFYFVQLLKGRGESRADIPDLEYVVEFDKSGGDDLGLALVGHKSAGCLLVKEVTGGLAAMWNEGRTVDNIRPGDRIVQVNDCVGFASSGRLLSQECRDAQKLVVTFRRDSECFYLKRLTDFRKLYRAMLEKHERHELPEAFNTGSWPTELPSEPTFGVRHKLSTLGVSMWDRRRLESLQEFMDFALERVETLDSEPLIAAFFGINPVSKSRSGPSRDVLLHRLEGLVEKHASR